MDVNQLRFAFANLVSVLLYGCWFMVTLFPCKYKLHCKALLEQVYYCSLSIYFQDSELVEKILTMFKNIYKAKLIK